MLKKTNLDLLLVCFILYGRKFKGDYTMQTGIPMSIKSLVSSKEKRNQPNLFSENLLSQKAMLEV